MSNLFRIFEDDNFITDIDINTDDLIIKSKINETFSSYALPREVLTNIAIQMISKKDGSIQRYKKEISHNQILDKYIKTLNTKIKPYTLYYTAPKKFSYDDCNEMVWYFTKEFKVIAFCKKDSGEYSSQYNCELSEYKDLRSFIECHAYLDEKKLIFTFTDINEDKELVKRIIDNFLNRSFENSIGYNYTQSCKTFFFDLQPHSYYLIFDINKQYIGIGKTGQYQTIDRMYSDKDYFLMDDLFINCSLFGYFYIYTESENE